MLRTSEIAREPKSVKCGCHETDGGKDVFGSVWHAIFPLMGIPP